MTNGKPGVMLYFELMESLQHLSDKNAGQLFKAIMHYAREGSLPDLGPNLLPLWGLIRNKIDFDDASYLEKTRKMQYGAYVRWQRVEGQEPLPYEAWIAQR